MQSISIFLNIVPNHNQGDFISIDQVSVFGTEQNIRNTITKRSIDDQGIHKFYEHSSAPKRNAKEQLELYDSTVTETLEELHQNGVDAVSLTPDTFTSALKDNKIVFVDFYAKYVTRTRLVLLHHSAMLSFAALIVSLIKAITVEKSDSLPLDSFQCLSFDTSFFLH